MQTTTMFWLSNLVAEIESEAELLNDSNLGLSPSEIEHKALSEAEREPIQWGHQGCPEFNLTNVYDV